MFPKEDSVGLVCLTLNFTIQVISGSKNKSDGAFKGIVLLFFILFLQRLTYLREKK
jgi:hypothetical protein